MRFPALKTGLCAAIFAAAPFMTGTASAEPFERIKLGHFEHVNAVILEILGDRESLALLRAQNRANAGLGEEDMKRMDEEWLAEDSALAAEILGNALSAKLAEIMARKPGFITEIIVMDNLGGVVGVNPKTSDYWQGDEAKWLATFSAGPEARHTAKPEFDDSADAWQQQLSAPILINGRPAGAVTLGIGIQTGKLK